MASGNLTRNLSDSNSSNWSDAFSWAFKISIVLSDNNGANWNDARLSVGYVFNITDNLNNWLDVATVVLGEVLNLSDSDTTNSVLNWADSYATFNGAYALNLFDFTGNGKYQDNFNRANGSLGSPWINTDTGTLQIISNSVGILATDQTKQATVVYGGASTPDQYSQVVILNPSTTSNQYVCVRNDQLISGDRGYIFGFANGGFNNGKYYLSWHNINDVGFVLGMTSRTPNANDLIEIRVSSTGTQNEIICYVNGVLVIETSDGHVNATGCPALEATLSVAADTTLFENWQGGPISALSPIAGVFPDNLTTGGILQLSIALVDGFGYGIVQYGTGYYGDSAWLDQVVTSAAAPAILPLPLSDTLVLPTDSIKLFSAYGFPATDTIVFSDNVNSSFSAFSFVDQLTLTDQVVSRYGLIIAETLIFSEAVGTFVPGQSVFSQDIREQLPLSDAPVITYGYIFSGEQIVLSDSFRLSVGLVITDAIVIGYGLEAYGQDPYGIGRPALSDAIGFSGGLALNLVLQDANSAGYGLGAFGTGPYGLDTNWVDTFAFSLTTGAILLTLSDDNSTNWDDSGILQQIAFAIQVTEQIGFLSLDSFTIAQPVAEVMSDSMTLTDFVATTFGFVSGPQINVGLNDSLSLSDAIAFGIGYAPKLSDSLSMSDAMSFNAIVLQLSDNINSPYGTAPYGQAPYSEGWQDSIVLSTVFAGLTNLVLSDNLANWDDTGLAITSDFGILVTEYTAMNWQDAVSILLLIMFSDQLTMSDQINANLIQTNPTEAVSDALTNQADALTFGIGYTLFINDSLAFSDAIAQVFTGILLTDSLVWTDSIGTKIGLANSDSLNILDSIGSTISLTTSDQLPLSDGALGLTGLTWTLGDIISEDAEFNWTDSIFIQAEFDIQAVDNFVFSESIVDFIGYLPTDQLAISDAVTYTLSDSITDQIVMSDAISLGIGYAFFNSVPTYVDIANMFFSAPTLTINVFEQLTIFDFVTSTYGFIVAESQTLSETFTEGFPESIVAADSLALQDSIKLLLADFFAATEQLSLTDSFQPIALMNVRLSDNFTLDDSPINGGIYVRPGLIIGDSSTFTDEIAVQELIAAAFADSFSISDATIESTNQQFFDQMSQSEFVAFTLVDIIAEQFVFTDVTTLGLGILLTDAAPQYLDIPVSISAGAAVISINQIEILPAMADSVAFTISYTISESLSIADFFTQGFVLSESFAASITLSDAVAEIFGYYLVESEQITLSDAAQVVASEEVTISDQLSLSDSTGTEIGLLEKEISLLSDSIAYLGVNLAPYTDSFVLSDLIIEEFDFQFFEQLFQLDFVTSAPTEIIAEQLVMSDSVTLILELDISIADVTSIYLDSLAIFINAAVLGVDVFDVITMSEKVAYTYGDIIFDTLQAIVFSDVFEFSFILFSPFSDTLTVSDSTFVTLDYLVPLSDQLVLTDSVNVVLGENVQLSDQLVWTDSEFITWDLLFVESEQMQMLDNFQLSISRNTALSDQLASSDQVILATSYEIVGQDQGTLSDKDLEVYSFEMNLQDIPAGWIESVQRLIDLRVAVGDNLNLWNDFLGGLHDLNLAVQDDDSSDWVEEIIISLQHILNLVDDNSASWNDSYTQKLLEFVPGMLADDNGANWLDQLLTFLGPGLGPVSVQSIQIQLRVIISGRQNVNSV